MPEEKKGSVPLMENPPAPPKTYPTEPDKDGFYYKTEEEQTAGILTRDYENGASVKQVKLKNNQVAIIRKLRGRDFVETKKTFRDDNTLDFETVNMAQAIEIDGKKQPPEFYLDDLFQADYVTLAAAFNELNFS